MFTKATKKVNILGKISFSKCHGFVAPSSSSPVVERDLGNYKKTRIGRNRMYADERKIGMEMLETLSYLFT